MGGSSEHSQVGVLPRIKKIRRRVGTVEKPYEDGIRFASNKACKIINLDL